MVFVGTIQMALRIRRTNLTPESLAIGNTLYLSTCDNNDMRFINFSSIFQKISFTPQYLKTEENVNNKNQLIFVTDENKIK